jgi:hypothetical protein
LEDAPMNRLRRWPVVCFVMAAAGFTAAADQPPPGVKPGEEKWMLDRSLTISPSGEPRPALKYRLLPVATDLKEGNAVPIYLRLRAEVSDKYRKFLVETPLQWRDTPIDQVPLAEARKYLDEVRPRFLTQLDYGARRKTADWNYTLDQPDKLMIGLPDTQEMRGYAWMLVLQARINVVDGDFAAAARSFETGFAFSRHVANGPSFVNYLIGAAIGNILVDRIPEWIEHPNSPNLYWALTALPRPLIDMRNHLEFDRGLLEMQFPELADLGRARSAAEWDATLKRFRAEVRRIYPYVKGNENVETRAPDEPAARSPDLTAARAFVVKQSGKSVADVAAMAPAQVLLQYIANTYADHGDEVYKLAYLPYAAAHPRLAIALKGLHDPAGGEGGQFAMAYLPAIKNVWTAEVRLDRENRPDACDRSPSPVCCGPRRATAGFARSGDGRPGAARSRN